MVAANRFHEQFGIGAFSGVFLANQKATNVLPDFKYRCNFWTSLPALAAKYFCREDGSFKSNRLVRPRTLVLARDKLTEELFFIQYNGYNIGSSLAGINSYGINKGSSGLARPRVRAGGPRGIEDLA